MRLLLPLLFACSPGSADVAGPGGGPEDIAKVSIDAQSAFDPLRGDLAWTVTGLAGTGVTVSVLDGDTELWSTQETVGADGTVTGTWAPTDAPETGLLSIQAATGKASALDDFAVVRPAFTQANFAGDDRIPLYWRGGQTLQDVTAAVSTTSDIDRFPELSEDIVAPPDDGSAQPVAYPATARPTLELTVPSTTDLGGTGLEDAVVEVSIDGWTAVDAQMTTGGTVTLQLDEPLSDSVGVTETELELVFEAVDGETRIELGSQILPIRIYRVLGPQTTGFTSDDANPWVAAVDPALRAIDGTYAEHNAVVDALVDWVYTDNGLVYDSVAGASFYSDYVGFSWDQPHFFLSDFLVRRNGTTVNCSDSGNILGTFANLLGAELVHIVILENFQLNEIQAIGNTSFTSCPFGPWGCGFSYHAVTTNTTSADFIWDATLAVDGDADPGSAPSVPLLVQTLTGDEYLSRLVRSGSADYDYPARITFE